MKAGISQEQIIGTAKSMGLPTDGFVQRRLARAFDLLRQDKVTEVDDGIFRVRSQWDEDKRYIVNLNHGHPSCDCPDGRRTINCKHRLASLIFAERQVKKSDVVRWKKSDVACWIDGNTIGNVWRGRTRWMCSCGKTDCKHIKKAVPAAFRFTDSGTEEARELQDKLNRLDQKQKEGKEEEEKEEDNSSSSSSPPSFVLDRSDPFQESEQLDIDQIEGRLNGEVVHKLSNSEYVMSYQGIM